MNIIEVHASIMNIIIMTINGYADAQIIIMPVILSFQ